MAYDLAKTRAEVEGSSIKTAIIRIEVRPAAAAAPPCLPSPPAHFVVACSCLSVDDPRLYGTAAQELAPFPTEALHQQLDQFKAVCGTTLCAPRLSAVPLSPLTHMRPCSGHRAPVFCSPLDWLCGSGDVLRVGARGGCRKRCLDVGGCPCVRHEARPQEDCGEYLGCPPTHTHTLCPLHTGFSLGLSAVSRVGAVKPTLPVGGVHVLDVFRGCGVPACS